MAIKVRPYTNTESDDTKVGIKYIVKHVYSSPVMVADYENDVSLSDANFYLDRGTLNPPASPCCNDSLIRAYTERRDNSTWISQLGYASEEETPDREMSSSLNRETLKSFSELI
jgi:hypothetical protein